MIPQTIYALTHEQAVSLLPPGDDIHVFMNPALNILIGADWGRDQLLAALIIGHCFIAGPQALAMGHGLVIQREGLPTMFVATIPNAIQQHLPPKKQSPNS